MSSDQANPAFDDPALCAALRKQLGRETAPPSLRARVLVALDEAETAPPERSSAPPPRLFLRRPMVRLAIAASVLVVLAAGALIASRSNEPPKRSVAVLPAAFAVAMAQQHDICRSSSDHLTPGESKDDLRLISKKFRDELGFPALVAMLDDGWQFQGARICPIGDVRTAHLLFTRGDQSLSVFSIPGKAVYSPQDGATYHMTVDQHPIAGFVRGTTMYCLVGKSASGDLTLAQVQAITDALEKRLRDGRTARSASLDPALLASR
ncbi:hypothetical protein BH09PLA1_BH09PLA1_26090 [soil metagenome]